MFLFATALTTPPQKVRLLVFFIELCRAYLLHVKSSGTAGRTRYIKAVRGHYVSEEFIHNHVFQLKTRRPYLSGLGMLLPFRAVEVCGVPTTNGAEVLYDRDFLQGFAPESQLVFLARPLLHLVLQHPARCGQDARLRVAAELVVNRILSVGMGLALPPGSLRAPEGASGSAEEVAARLRGPLPFCDAFSAPGFAPANLALLHSIALGLEATLPKSVRPLAPLLQAAGLSVAEVEAPAAPHSWAASLQRITAGQGEPGDFPRDLVERFLWMQWLGANIPDTEAAVAAFLYAVKHVPVVWVALFGNQLMISMRAKKQEGRLALRIQKEPLLRQYLTSYQNLLGLGG